ncbi:hypothetical protein M3Y97_00622100 [Aphelenchoides bicaudatus]|nr:hypothetical protein M3Y97_00622100 [Aphelenchoides bicaudatus]
MKLIFFILVLFCVSILSSEATISQSFRNFIRSKYGASVEKQLARQDFENGRGSFGGGNHEAGTKTSRIPVILVHGSSTVAAHGLGIAAYFKSQGYSDSELYATTYGEPIPGSPYGRNRGYLCEYVKGVRNMIKAVSQFTGQKVDVMAYSMGSPISRKAILGGKCTDTGEDLGPPLTNTVHTYLSVAGVGRSTSACGSRCGPNCGNAYLNDINAKSHYEGQRVYILQSTADTTITKDKCGNYISELAGSDKVVTLSKYGHVQVCLLTARFLLLFVFICSVDATISNSFYNYIQQQFGDTVAQQLARNDNPLYSYGGGLHKAGERTNKAAVVFVHGYMTSAQNTKPMADYFKQNYGYSDEELYATTFGSTGIFPVQTAMTCEYSKLIRYFIQAVSGFTNSSINVIAYSMGSPVSRKSILGGVCVDTKENIGSPITNLVNVFLGVAGANFGARACFLPVGICNKINGMHCQSQFLQDINNSAQHYEGQKVYVMLSTNDDIVGYQVCGQTASAINGADNTVVLNGLRHIEICSTRTSATQYNLLTSGTQ